MENYVDPTREQFGAMMKLPDAGPIHMLNLLKFRASAAYPDGHPEAGAARTGAEAYALYGRDSAPIFKRVGGRIVYAAAPQCMLIGPGDEAWDAAFVAEYPSAAAFAEMIKDPDYQRAVAHRQAAVETSRLVRMAPQQSGATFAG
ncbi:MAG: DUF1330 domain-containing protein [Pseudomonadota bacterium]